MQDISNPEMLYFHLKMHPKYAWWPGSSRTRWRNL